MRIVRHGLNGTAMLPWDVSDARARRRRAVSQDLLCRSGRPRSPARRSCRRPIRSARRAPPPPSRAATEVFHETAQCAKCHEKRELKTTEFCLRWKPGWKTLDERDCELPLRELPPDLGCDPLRSVYPGTELVDLYRTIAAGIGGAGMPTWKGALSEEELWSVAYYVRSLGRARTGCSGSRTGQ